MVMSTALQIKQTRNTVNKGKVSQHTAQLDDMYGANVAFFSVFFALSKGSITNLINIRRSLSYQ